MGGVGCGEFLKGRGEVSKSGGRGVGEEVLGRERALSMGGLFVLYESALVMYSNCYVR